MFKLANRERNYGLRWACLLISILSASTFACTLTLAVSNEFPPYHLKNADGSWGGVSIDIANTLVERSGCELEILDIPWKRSIKLLAEGKIHILTNFSFNAERSQFAQFLGPHHIEKVAFIAKEGLSVQVSDLRSLSGFDGLIGITRGNEFGQSFNAQVLQDELLEQKLVFTKNNKDRNAMLLSDHIDSMFDDEFSARYLLATQEHKKSGYEIRFTMEGNPVYFGISNKGVALGLRKKLNEVWLGMLQQDMLFAMYKQYGLVIDKVEWETFPVKMLLE
jgi:ABC-type amino acid transport substrate-binding protein